MKLKFTFILVLLIFHNSYALHPINLSVGDIVYKDKKLHLKFKFFTDDLQATISQYCKTGMDLMNKGIDGNTEKCIERYIAAKFQTSINGVPLKWVYKKAYMNESVVYVEYEAKLENPAGVKSVKITNTLLFDVIAEQKNIINLNLFGKDDIKILVFNNDASEFTKEQIYN
jgi:hypothetical protein